MSLQEGFVVTKLMSIKLKGENMIFKYGRLLTLLATFGVTNLMAQETKAVEAPEKEIVKKGNEFIKLQINEI